MRNLIDVSVSKSVVYRELLTFKFLHEELREVWLDVYLCNLDLTSAKELQIFVENKLMEALFTLTTQCSEKVKEIIEKVFPKEEDLKYEKMTFNEMGQHIIQLLAKPRRRQNA